MKRDKSVGSMSCQENDRVIESAYEKAIEEGFDEAILCEMDLEYLFEYLTTGKMPECYERIGYQIYKL